MSSSTAAVVVISRWMDFGARVRLRVLGIKTHVAGGMWAGSARSFIRVDAAHMGDLGFVLQRRMLRKARAPVRLGV